MRAVPALAAGLLLAACAPSYTVHDLAAPQGALSHAKAVLVSMPDDARFGDIRYPGSGSYTAHAVRRAFRRHAIRVDITAGCHGPACVAEPYGAPYGYYVEPEILHWEDRATAWSRRPDRVEIKLTVYDLFTGLPVSTHVFEGESPKGTLVSDRPRDLLAEPLARYVRGLYG